MGDTISNDIICGMQCSICGVRFMRAHGYPVVCSYCFESSLPKERKAKRLVKAAYQEQL